MLYNCLCLNCARIFLLNLAAESELGGKTCPECGSDKLRVLASKSFST